MAFPKDEETYNLDPGPAGVKAHAWEGEGCAAGGQHLFFLQLYPMHKPQLFIF